MKRFVLSLLLLSLFLFPCSALALTEEDAYARITELDGVVGKTITSDNSIMIWSKRTGYNFDHENANFIFTIRTNAGRPVPWLRLYKNSDEPLDVNALKISYVVPRHKRGRVTEGAVEFRVPSNGIVRCATFQGYLQFVTLGGTTSGELDKFASLAKLCGRYDDVTVELKSPVASEAFTLSETEKKAVVEMWDYFAAYAFLAETYHEPPGLGNIGRYTEEGYNARFLEIIEEFGLTAPQRETVIEGPSPQTDLAADSFEQRKVLAEQNRLIEEGKRILAEQEKIQAEIEKSLREQERQKKSGAGKSESRSPQYRRERGGTAAGEGAVFGGKRRTDRALYCLLLAAVSEISHGVIAIQNVRVDPLALSNQAYYNCLCALKWPPIGIGGVDR